MRPLRDGMLGWGRCPQTPGIYRLGARVDYINLAVQYFCSERRLPP